ncbi:MAG: outer membrane lipoprotein-sorting protein, partial [Cytophagales bacterium]|nr:outer membrane lipoprotein-sorting protein [Cytophagales bacterium]
AQKILDNYFVQHGGIKKLSSLNTYAEEANLEVEGGSTLVMKTFAKHQKVKRLDVYSDDKFVTSHIIFFDISLGRSGTESKYRKVPMRQYQPDSSALNIQDEILGLVSSKDTLVFEGSTSVNREKCFVLKHVGKKKRGLNSFGGTSNTSVVTTYYISRKRFLILRKRTYDLNLSGQVIPGFRIDYKDYEEVKGFWFPLKVLRYSDADNRLMSTTLVQRVEPNKDLDDKLFRVPTEVEDEGRYRPPHSFSE